ncbi:hypothetical protein LshimejAT787_0207700 [Lyophyllum shimeji]|uniref:Uncharacterized protein n=1 Tax=Lyophyllum shimeji TaxID=47721 RepID=A0A9P3PFR8_LYOSH|nr:hypothetical protein LshimejAT787_0207700 [Lyophyllum shimeji]
MSYDMLSFRGHHCTGSRDLPILNEIITVAAAYAFTYIALQDRAFRPTPERSASIRYHYATFLVLFEIGCLTYGLSTSPMLSLSTTAKALTGCGAAGMFICVSAGKSSQSLADVLFEPSFWHFQYIATIITLLLPLFGNVFFPHTYVILCCEPLYAAIRTSLKILKQPWHI